MTKLIHILKLIIKCVYFNGTKGLSLGTKAGVGAFSKVLFSKIGIQTGISSISIGNYGGIGRFCELHVLQNNHINIKDYSTLNDGCKILGDVTIERHCLFSSNIFASSGNHYAFVKPTWLIKDQDSLVWSTEKDGRVLSQPIHVEEDCWIGYGVFIKQGVYIGRGAIIGANSVVMKNVPPYSVQGGSPSKEIKKRIEFNPPLHLLAGNDELLPYFYRGFNQRREVLVNSLKKGIIYSFNESIVFLKHTNDWNELMISGKKNSNTTYIEVLIELNGKHQWKRRIDDENFNFTLNKANVDFELSLGELYNTIKEDSIQYNIVTLKVLNFAVAEQQFGIKEIRIS